MIEHHTIVIPPMPPERADIIRKVGKRGTAATIRLLDYIIDNRLRLRCDAALRELVDFRRRER